MLVLVLPPFAVSMGKAAKHVSSACFKMWKLEDVSHEMLVVVLPLQNLSFSKVSKQVVMSFCVAGVALCDITTCLLTCRKCQDWGKPRTKCWFCCSHVSRLESLVFLWRRRVYGGSGKTSLFRRLPSRLSCRFSWQAWHFVTWFIPCRKFFYVAGSTMHSTLYTLHFRLHTLHSTLYTLHSTLHTLHFTLCTPHSTLYTPHFTLCTLHSSLHTLPFTLYTLHSTLHTLHFTHSTLHTLHSTLLTLHSTLHTLHFPLHTLHSTLHNLHFTLHTPHSTLYTPHFTLCTPHSTLYTPHFTLCTLHSSLHTLHSTLHTPRFALHTPNSIYTLHSKLYTPHFTFYAPHFTLYTPHSALHTPHSTLYTLHSTLYTLYTPHFTLRTPYFTLHTPHCTLSTPHSALYTFHSTLQTGNRGNMCKTVQINYCRKVLCVTAYPCVSTSVPLTYVWAFGFVGCILFQNHKKENNAKRIIFQGMVEMSSTESTEVSKSNFRNIQSWGPVSAPQEL